MNVSDEAVFIRAGSPVVQRLGMGGLNIRARQSKYVSCEVT